MQEEYEKKIATLEEAVEVVEELRDETQRQEELLTQNENELALLKERVDEVEGLRV